MSRALTTAALLLGWAVTLALAERARPLRPMTDRTAGRWRNNAALGASAAPVVAALVQPAARAATVERRWGWGSVARIAALDLLYWAWHRANHQVPLLWRIHRRHHLDPDLDVSSALRFPAAELLVSVPFRWAQVSLARPSDAELRVYDLLFAAATLFHHSNVDLGDLDRRLVLAVVTPRMRGIHHTADQAAANWGVLTSLWDRLARTLRYAGQGPPPPIGAPGR